MRRYGILCDKVVAFDNLLLPALKPRRGKRDRVGMTHFIFHLELELLTLQEALRAGMCITRVRAEGLHLDAAVEARRTSWAAPADRRPLWYNDHVDASFHTFVI